MVRWSSTSIQIIQRPYLFPYCTHTDIQVDVQLIPPASYVNHLATVMPLAFKENAFKILFTDFLIIFQSKKNMQNITFCEYTWERMPKVYIFQTKAVQKAMNEKKFELAQQLRGK